jgi:F-type H+-transporting ATPase subunit gamma
LATLKEIKTRIQSVKSTQKITSAMKMVSSAKLHKAEKSIENSLAYKNSLLNIQADLLCENPSYRSILMEERVSSKTALLVFTSNSSLCGGFNSNIIKRLNSIVTYYIETKIEFEIIPIGKKATQACSKLELETASNFEKIIDKPHYADIEQLATQLIAAFLSKKYDRIELLFYKYNSKANQEIVKEQFLPYVFNNEKVDENPTADFLFEPKKNEILDALLPQILKMELFQTLLNTVCSEHATRTNAMQIATDNADDLLEELSLQYNKSRQQSITNELLDIMGGSFK